MDDVWRAAKGAGVTVHAWFGDHETGVLDLLEYRDGQGEVLLKSNVPGEDLSCDVHEVSGRIQLRVRAVAMSHAGAALPVFIEVAQAGAIVSADDGSGPPPLNGPAPFKPRRQTPDAPHNSPQRYYFEVAFQ